MNQSMMNEKPRYLLLQQQQPFICLFVDNNYFVLFIHVCMKIIGQLLSGNDPCDTALQYSQLWHISY